MGTVIPPNIINALTPANQALILGKEFFPTLISSPFKSGLIIAFPISVILSVIAALASLMRGKRVIYNEGDNAPIKVAAVAIEEKAKKGKFWLHG